MDHGFIKAEVFCVFFFNSLELQLWAWNILYSSAICYAPGISARTFRPNVMEKNFKEF